MEASARVFVGNVRTRRDVFWAFAELVGSATPPPLFPGAHKAEVRGTDASESVSVCVISDNSHCPKECSKRSVMGDAVVVDREACDIEDFECLEVFGSGARLMRRTVCWFRRQDERYCIFYRLLQLIATPYAR